MTSSSKALLHVIRLTVPQIEALLACVEEELTVSSEERCYNINSLKAVNRILGEALKNANT